MSFILIIDKIILCIIIGFTFITVIIKCFRMIQKGISSKEDLACVIIHFPQSYFWIGVFDVIFCCLLPVGVLVYPSVFVGASFFETFIYVSPFLLLGIVIMIWTSNWEICLYNKNRYLMYTTFFGQRYRLLYSEITHFRVGKQTIVMTVKSKKYYIDRDAENVSRLLDLLMEMELSHDHPERAL